MYAVSSPGPPPPPRPLSESLFSSSFLALRRAGGWRGGTKSELHGCGRGGARVRMRVEVEREREGFKAAFRFSPLLKKKEEGTIEEEMGGSIVSTISLYTANER